MDYYPRALRFVVAWIQHGIGTEEQHLQQRQLVLAVLQEVYLDRKDSVKVYFVGCQTVTGLRNCPCCLTKAPQGSERVPCLLVHVYLNQSRSERQYSDQSRHRNLGSCRY